VITKLIGKKIGMTQIFNETGDAVPVTIIEVEDALVIDKKTKERDGYTALKLGWFDVRKAKRVSKALKGVFKNEKKNKDLGMKKVVREIRVDQETLDQFNVGDKITVDQLKDMKFVDVSGETIGRGWQGVVKRHGFAGGSFTHGSNQNRAPGSIGSSTYPARVFKNMKMGGHMGTERVTIMNLRLEKVDTENKFVLVRGAVPGADNSIVEIRKSVKKK